MARTPLPTTVNSAPGWQNGTVVGLFFRVRNSPSVGRAGGSWAGTGLVVRVEQAGGSGGPAGIGPGGRVGWGQGARFGRGPWILLELGTMYTPVKGWGICRWHWR